jgi:hypothetical protein
MMSRKLPRADHYALNQRMPGEVVVISLSVSIEHRLKQRILEKVTPSNTTASL